MTLTAEPIIVSTDPILGVTSCVMNEDVTHMTIAIDTHTLLHWYQSGVGTIDLAKIFDEAVADELDEHQDFGQDPLPGDKLYILRQSKAGLVPEAFGTVISIGFDTVVMLVGTERKKYSRESYAFRKPEFFREPSDYEWN